MVVSLFWLAVFIPFTCQEGVIFGTVEGLKTCIAAFSHFCCSRGTGYFAQISISFNVFNFCTQSGACWGWKKVQHTLFYPVSLIMKVATWIIKKNHHFKNQHSIYTIGREGNHCMIKAQIWIIAKRLLAQVSHTHYAFNMHCFRLIVSECGIRDLTKY